MSSIEPQLSRVFGDLRSGKLAGLPAEPQNKTQFTRKYYRWKFEQSYSFRRSNAGTKVLKGTMLVLGTVTLTLPIYLAIKGKFRRYVSPNLPIWGVDENFISRVTKSQWKSLTQFAKSSSEAHQNPAKDLILRSHAMKLIDQRIEAQELRAVLKQCSTRQLCQLARGIGKEQRGWDDNGKSRFSWSPAVFHQLREIQKSVQTPLLDDPFLQTFESYEANKAQAQQRVSFEQAVPGPASPATVPPLMGPLPETRIAGVRALAAELLLPSNLARASAMLSGGEKGLEATRDALREHLNAVAILCARSDVRDAKDTANNAKLPVGLGSALRQALGLHGPLPTQPALSETRWQEYVQDVESRIKSMTPVQAQSLAECMAQVVQRFDFKPYSEQLTKIETGLKGPAGNFFHEVFRDYFSHQPAMDQRSMIASLFRESLPSRSEDEQLAALLKGAGPFMHKALQLFCDKVPNESTKAALSSVKTGLTPIDRELKAAMLDRIVKDSGGKIAALSSVRTLGAASVGEAVLANVSEPAGPDGQTVSRQVVIKLLRPGITERAARERAFFTAAASRHPGMSQTFAGIGDQIEAELNLQTEAQNVQRGQVYNGQAEGLQAMKLSALVPPQPDYMVVERAAGSPLQKYIDLLEKAARGERIPAVDNLDPLALGKKAAEQVAELGRVWIKQAVAGDGFFHGDLHAGNLMFDGASGVLTAIDFGNAATIAKDQRQTAIRLGMALQRRHPRLFEKEFRKLLGPASEALAWDLKLNDTSIMKLRSIMHRVDLSEADKLSRILSEYTDAGIEVPAVISNFSRSMMMLEETLKRLNSANTVNHLRSDPQGKVLFEQRDQLQAQYRSDLTSDQRAQLDQQIERIDASLRKIDRPAEISLGPSFERALRPDATKLAWRAGLGFSARIVTSSVQNLTPKQLRIMELKTSLKNHDVLHGSNNPDWAEERGELQDELNQLLAEEPSEAQAAS